MPTYGICVLSFARPVKVLNCIMSIRRYNPSISIITYTDLAVNESPQIRKANQELISLLSQWKQEGLIQDFMVADTHLAPKRACYRALEWSLAKFDYVILIEDDLEIILDPNHFIQQSIMAMEKHDIIGMACLYTSRNHSTLKDESFRITNWPEMWGSIIGKCQFEQISKASRREKINVSDVVNSFSRSKLKSISTQLFRARFAQTWTYKYQRARNSISAWDTEWQCALWALGKVSIVPNLTLVADTGTDFTSVSPLKKNTQTLECDKLRRENHENFVMCRSCESRREHQNHVLPQRILATPILGRMLKEGII